MSLCNGSVIIDKYGGRNYVYNCTEPMKDPSVPTLVGGDILSKASTLDPLATPSFDKMCSDIQNLVEQRGTSPYCSIVTSH